MTSRILFATLAVAPLALGPAHGNHVKVNVALVPPDAITEYLAKGTVKSTETHPAALLSAARK